MSSERFTSSENPEIRASEPRSFRRVVVEILKFLTIPMIMIPSISILLLLLAGGSPKFAPHGYLCIPLAFISMVFLFWMLTGVKRIHHRHVIYVRILVIITVMLGLIPIIEAWFSKEASSSGLTIFYIIDATFVLVIAFPILSRAQKTTTIAVEVGTIQPELEKPLFLKVTYYSGPKSGRELSFPVTCNYTHFVFSLDMENISFAETMIGRAKTSFGLTKSMGEYQLRLGRLTFETSGAFGEVGHGTYAYLSRINTYIDGVFSSSITFHRRDEDTGKETQTTIPIIMPGSTTVFILPPIAIGLTKGRHIVAVEVIDSLGRVLEISKANFEIYNWMREKEIWQIIPAKISLPGFKYPKPITIYCKRESLPDTPNIDVADRISVAKVKVVSSSGKEDDKRRIKYFELVIDTLENYSLKTIEITIDESLQFKLVIEEPVPLFSGNRHVFMLPMLHPIYLPTGKHFLTLRILGRTSSLFAEEEEELLTYLKQFTCRKTKLTK